MKANGLISYYCFNKACKGSVYFMDTIQITDLPLTVDNLSHEHHCSLCHSKLVSVIDIELKRTLYKKQVAIAQVAHVVGV